MKVLILEDEPRTGKRLEYMLKQCDPTIIVLAHIPSVKKAAQWLTENQPPHIIFMDIHLEDDLVFRLFEQITITTPIIFTTAYDEYMIRAFKVNSLDYLLKPVQLLELQAALNKYRTLQQHYSQQQYTQLLSLLNGNTQPRYKERFMVTIGSRLITVDTNNIAYFSLESKMTFATTDSGQHLPLNQSLDTLTELLDPSRFFRINRQYIVALHAISTAQSYSVGKVKLELLPPPREDVFVSGDRIAAFKEWLGK